MNAKRLRLKSSGRPTPKSKSGNRRRSSVKTMNAKRLRLKSSGWLTPKSKNRIRRQSSAKSMNAKNWLRLKSRSETKPKNFVKTLSASVRPNLRSKKRNVRPARPAKFTTRALVSVSRRWSHPKRAVAGLMRKKSKAAAKRWDHVLPGSSGTRQQRNVRPLPNARPAIQVKHIV